MTTTVALRLVKQGSFDLDATLDKYVSATEGTSRGEIPIRILLTHTSGLPPYKAFPFGWESGDALLQSLYDSPLGLLAEPDEWFVYSDLNFVHLADASATDLRAFLEGTFPDWWLPDDVVFVDEVPKTATGKFDKKVLRDRFDDASLRFTPGEYGRTS